jgi:hypothetical protein
MFPPRVLLVSFANFHGVHDVLDALSALFLTSRGSGPKGARARLGVAHRPLGPVDPAEKAPLEVARGPEDGGKLDEVELDGGDEGLARPGA